MKNIRKYFGIAGIMLLALLFGSIASAITETECRTCHDSTYLGGVPTRHHSLVIAGEYGCPDCHPLINNNTSYIIETNCIMCHNGTAFYGNPLLNPGVPPHLPVTLNITYPKEGDVWTRGTAKTITWDYTGSLGPVKIELLKNGILDQTINSSISGINGAYNWAIPGSIEIGTDYQIRITSLLSVTGDIYTDTSDNFAISAGTEAECRYCHSENVVLRHHYFEEYVCYDCHPVINYSVLIERNCIMCHNGTAFYANPDLNPGVPLHLPATLDIASPGDGDVWIRGTTRTITWNYTGSPGPLKIELLESGILDQTINSSVSGIDGNGFYNWAIPKSIDTGTDYQIRITSILGTTGSIYTDTSNSFAIKRRN